jgi:lipoyl(octanoyl) transferase
VALRPIELEDLGLRDYEEVWEHQRRTLDHVATGSAERLLLVEHPHVITLGRGTKPENVLSRDVPIVQIERGGDATYHGPGQLVGYPLLRLREHGLGIHSYLRRLEDVLIQTVAQFGVSAGRLPRKTGVWVEDRKIASIGVAVRQGVSYHGFALNVNTDLSFFRHINPCGFDASVMTSLATVEGRPVPIGQVKHAVVDAFEEAFGVHVRSGMQSVAAPTGPVL